MGPPALNRARTESGLWPLEADAASRRDAHEPLVTRKRLGLLGCGAIGQKIGAVALEEGFAGVAFVHARDEAKALRLFPDAEFIADPADVAAKDVDLVVEAASGEVVRSLITDVLARRDMMIFTLTGLADDSLREAARRQCRAANTRLYIPHGGVLGMDGIFDGRHILDEVKITTTKAPRNLGLPFDRTGVLYDGPTRGACERFPLNVNVHACLALCGIGFDRTRSVLIADPATERMGHVIEVTGQGLDWRLDIASRAGTGVSGAYTPVSAASTVRRVLAESYDVVLA